MLNKKNFIEAEIWSVARIEKNHVVLIKPMGIERIVPIFICQSEAHSLVAGLQNMQMPRPLTHDLFVSMADKLAVHIKRVEITNLINNVFISNIVITKNGLRNIKIDARPSDSLGVVARINCPLYIARDIVESYSVALNMPDNNSETPDEHSFFLASNITETHSDMIESPNDNSSLEKQLEQAINEEDYEEAARLRDILQGKKRE